MTGHPLTNQAIDNLWDEAMQAAGPPATVLEVSRAACRAAYNLGREHEAEWQEGQPENYQLITIEELEEL